MTLKTLLWCALTLGLGSLVYNIVVERRYRQRNEVLPVYRTGNVAGGVGLVLLLLCELLGSDSSVSQALLAGCFTMLGIAITQTIIANRKRGRTGQG